MSPAPKRTLTRLLALFCSACALALANPLAPARAAPFAYLTSYNPELVVVDLATNAITKVPVPAATTPWT